MLKRCQKVKHTKSQAHKKSSTQKVKHTDYGGGSQKKKKNSHNEVHTY